MFSQVSVRHSVHNQPHGYLVTAHPCYGAVGTHPTGLFSCSTEILPTSFSKWGGAVFIVKLLVPQRFYQLPVSGSHGLHCIVR